MSRSGEARYLFFYPLLRQFDLVLIFLLATGCDICRIFCCVDYRPQSAFWSAMGEQLGHDAPVLGQTQDYGYLAAYWDWINTQPWPSLDDQTYHVLSGGSEDQFENLFTERVTGREFFFITDFDEFVNRPELVSYLEDDYPVDASGNGYLIYHLGEQK